MNIQKYWHAVLSQDAASMQSYFADGAWINWHNTNEHFTVEEFIRANCEYPGEWEGEVEQVFHTGEYTITAAAVRSKDGMLRFHVTSFLHMAGDKILSIDEYWGDDGAAPQWRQKLHIGSPING